MMALRQRFNHRAAEWLLAGIVAVFASGCASSQSLDSSISRAQGLKATRPPVLLNGPISLLLTNAADYRARVTVTQTNGVAEPFSGNIFQQEGWLLFVPMANASPSDRWAGRFRFLWDTKRRRGFVLSESLQGYAEIRAPMDPARIEMETPAEYPRPERIGERECTPHVVRRELTGAERRFRVWRSDEAAEPPIRIATMEARPGLIVTLEDLEVERLAPDLFLIPPTYVRYPDPESMIKEQTRKVHPLPYSHSYR